MIDKAKIKGLVKKGVPDFITGDGDVINEDMVNYIKSNIREKHKVTFLEDASSSSLVSETESEVTGIAESYNHNLRTYHNKDGSVDIEMISSELTDLYIIIREKNDIDDELSDYVKNIREEKPESCRVVVVSEYSVIDNIKSEFDKGDRIFVDSPETIARQVALGNR